MDSPELFALKMVRVPLIDISHVILYFWSQWSPVHEGSQSRLSTTLEFPFCHVEWLFLSFSKEKFVTGLTKDGRYFPKPDLTIFFLPRPCTSAHNSNKRHLHRAMQCGRSVIWLRTRLGWDETAAHTYKYSNYVHCHSPLLTLQPAAGRGRSL